MAIDAKYKKQIEKWGVDSILIVEDNFAKKQLSQYREVNLFVVRNLMETMDGRQWLFSKLDMCRVFTTPFIPTDSHGTSFFSGIQAVGQNLLDDIMKSSPENLGLMLQEAAARSAGKGDDFAS